MKTQPEFTGGCLCKAVRFRALGPVIAAAICHCLMCRRASGAPVVAFAAVARANFAWMAGVPASYRSSAHGNRSFCADCGSQLAFDSSQRPDWIEFNLGALDRPEALVPTYHVWCQSQLAWFQPGDSLPKLPANTAAAAAQGFVIPRHPSWGEAT